MNFHTTTDARRAERGAKATTSPQATTIEGIARSWLDGGAIELGPDDTECVGLWFDDLGIVGKRVKLTVEVMEP